MNLISLCVLMVALAQDAAGELPPIQTSYKILMLLPMSTKSNRNHFMFLAEALGNRGHKVVMLTNHPSSSTHPNITELTHGIMHFKEDQVNIFDVGTELIPFQLLSDIFVKFSQDFYKVEAVMDLYKRRKDFDLIIAHHTINEVVYPFLHEAVFITFSPIGLDPRVSAVVGNVLNPSYVPNHMDYLPSHPSLWSRFRNLARIIVHSIYYKKWLIGHRMQQEISVHFPELPPLLEIEKNQSLMLLNSHFSMSTTLPLLPSQVEVGSMHCRPAKPLPATLQSWVKDAGSAGVIYFSLGSLISVKYMPVKYLNLFLEAFRRLPQRVLWKYEEKLETAPENVMTSKWLPQQDVLAQDNVKVFISHGGLLSVQEAIFHSTPLLVIPVFADQIKNGMFVEVSGLGLMLKWEKLTVDVIVDTLTEIINNHKYKENILRLSTILLDQLSSPQERAVYWTEYVIRHRGAPHLRCPAAQLSWVEFLLLDMLAILLVATLVLLYTLRRVLTAISKIFRSVSVKKKRE